MSARSVLAPRPGRCSIVGALHAIEPQGLAHESGRTARPRGRALAHCWELLGPFRHRIDKIYSRPARRRLDQVLLRRSRRGGRDRERDRPDPQRMLVMRPLQLTTGSLRCWPEDRACRGSPQSSRQARPEAVTLPSYGGGHADMLAALGMALPAPPAPTTTRRASRQLLVPVEAGLTASGQRGASRPPRRPSSRVGWAVTRPCPAGSAATPPTAAGTMTSELVRSE